MDGSSKEGWTVIKVIKTEQDHRAALARIEELIDRDPAPGTAEADELEVLAVLTEDFESKVFALGRADAVDAILFRMEQEGLNQRSLVPYLGSKSKVSEVLNRKRPLTLPMIRALHAGLGIPARILLEERDPELLEDSGVDWSRFPLREMIVRGWISAKLDEIEDQAEDILRTFFRPIGKPTALAALYRRSDHVRSGRIMDQYALTAWTAWVTIRAIKEPVECPYVPGTLTLDVMRELAQLSWSQQGPVLAKEFLGKLGIALIVEPHLSRTHLDGAALLVDRERPVIGLTLRHDRIDNFWFALMHELAHLSLHFDSDVTRFFDDLDVDARDDQKEQEADTLAGEALIPSDEWERSPAKRLRSPEAAEHLAKKLRIHPAIVAGRMRHQFNSYRVLSQMVGHGQVRQWFPGSTWSE
jgi:HTH-type transcriptional regulator / antitoxin HigA